MEQLQDITDSKAFSYLIRFFGLAIIDAFAIWFSLALISDGAFLLAGFLAVVTLGLNVIFLVDNLYPFRWFSPGLFLLIMVVMYPAIFTIYIAFTNYGDGNLLTKEQALQLFEEETYLPEGGQSYEFTLFQSEADDSYAMWLINEETQETVWALPNEPFINIDDVEGVQGINEDGTPTGVDSYTLLEVRDYLRLLGTLQEIKFGADTDAVVITGAGEAKALQLQYAYDAEADTMTDLETGLVYSPVEGTFTAEDGATLTPGYYVPIGLDNFERLFTSEAIRGPFSRVFVWTIFHAVAAVFLQFWFGLGLALVFDNDFVPAKKFLRSIILIPYAIPSFIAVLIWRGMLNENLGLISTTMNDFGIDIPWFSDPTWAKIGILFIQIWVGFPYMMLICTGALQSIPANMYEAAQVDGASSIQRFWNLTFPLLLVAVGPLLIASFAFNFNNFTVIRLYAEGGPPIPNATTPAGHTDILISYSYRVAFASGRGADYAFATAITVVIFIMVSLITLVNFQLTKRLEEISESV